MSYGESYLSPETASASLTPGTYYLEVYNYDDAWYGPYSISVGGKWKNKKYSFLLNRSFHASNYWKCKWNYWNQRNFYLHW